jgi:hypothetical protein
LARGTDSATQHGAATGGGHSMALNVQQMTRPDQEREKALKILARSIFKELKSQGYEAKQIVSLATELISEVTSDLQHDTDSTPNR